MRGDEVLISLTSVPRRFARSLAQTVAGLRRQSIKPTILLNIPTHYRKWGEAPPLPFEIPPGVKLYRPSQDFGPATKLLGALEYIRDRPQIRFIATADDDLYPPAAGHLQYLLSCAAALPGSAITMGGILLEREPFRADDGLSYGKTMRLVHAPAGYRGVVYPAAPLRENNLPFELRKRLPEGIFQDDDAYFGCVLSALGIPLASVPGRPRMRKTDGAGASAVAEKAERSRIDNEMTIFQAAVGEGLLEVPIADPAISLKARASILLAYLRFRIGSKISRVPRPENLFE